jgi:hypothetical protein
VIRWRRCRSENTEVLSWCRLRIESENFIQVSAVENDAGKDAPKKFIPLKF